MTDILILHDSSAAADSISRSLARLLPDSYSLRYGAFGHFAAMHGLRFDEIWVYGRISSFYEAWVRDAAHRCGKMSGTPALVKYIP